MNRTKHCFVKKMCMYSNYYIMNESDFNPSGTEFPLSLKDPCTVLCNT